MSHLQICLPFDIFLADVHLVPENTTKFIINININCDNQNIHIIGL